MSKNDRLQIVTQKLNSVSSSFCLAKWTTVSLHLESGTTHSCHHPPAHQIPVNNLDNNPSLLHNTPFKIEQRKKMLNGERPSECNFCWNIEDLKNQNISDRFLKSARPEFVSRFDEVLQQPLSENFLPNYVEASFSNTCQFKCSYCSSNYSSSWEEEINKFGPYETGSGAKDIQTFNEDENPYIKAFWQWWPELSQKLHTFRITGGEPLLSPTTYKVLEMLINKPAPQLNISINTNLGVPNVLFDKFIALAKTLSEKKAVADLTIFTSIDGFAEQAEYIRFGLKHESFWQNVERVLNADPKIKVSIMSTFNALSFTSYIPLLEKVTELNVKHRNEMRNFPVEIDITYLRYPAYQAVQVLTPDFIVKGHEILNYLKTHRWPSLTDRTGFYDHHYSKMQRIVDWMKAEVDETLRTENRKKFYSFFAEHDRRRNTNFLKTFPEMAEFWRLCQHLYESKNK